MPIFISRSYHFESAHFLPRVAETHRCRRLHGHNYKIEVTLAGYDISMGWVLDFWDLDKIVQPLVDKVDHRCLNDIDGLSNPTAENIAQWFFDQLVKDLRTLPHAAQRDPPVHLVDVTVWEVEGSKAKATIQW